MLRTTVAATGDRKHWAGVNWANPTLQGLCSQKQHLSIHGLSKQLGFRDIFSHIWAAAADLNQSETILWFYNLNQNFSKREKRKWGEEESQHHSVNEYAISHSTSLGHDQWSLSRPGWVRSGMSGAQTVDSQRTSCPWSLLSLLDKKVPAFPTTHLLGEAWHQPAIAVPVTGSSCLKEGGWGPSETLHISERAIWLPAGRQYTNCHTRTPDLMREDFNHSFLTPGLQMA